MSSPVITVSPNTSLRECSALMLEKDIRRVVVAQGNEIVGIVSDTDIFSAVEERGWGPTF
jgi:isocitrate dehydrogenase